MLFLPCINFKGYSDYYILFKILKIFMNYPLIVTVLDNIFQKVTDDTKITGTIYDSVEELNDDLENYMDEMADNNGNWIQYIDMNFKQNGNWSKIAALNDWGEFWEEQKALYLSAKQPKS